jgi:OmpA-OmpF porin, OOP family
MSTLSLRAAFLVTVFLSSLAATASAQVLPSGDVRTWAPSTDPAASLVLEPTATPGPWNWNVGAWAMYANNPVVLTQGASGAVALRPVENLFGADLTANLGLGKRAAIGIDLPTVLYEHGSRAIPTSVVTSGAVSSSALGDLVLTGKGAILTNDDGGFGLAALGAVSFPTGDRESFMGDGSATVTARLLADYSMVFASIQASLGYKLRTGHQVWPNDAAGVTFGDEIPWSIGFLFHPGLFRKLDPADRQTWEVAFHGSLPGGPVGPFGTGSPGSKALSPALFAFSDRVALGHFRNTYVLVGGDVGLDDAVGVPTFRGIVSVGWAPREHDKDHDGVPDDVDQCPMIAEDRDGYEDNDGCPDMDNDEDGIPDAFDACPNVKGISSSDPTKNGCPAGATTSTPTTTPTTAPSRAP